MSLGYHNREELIGRPALVSEDVYAQYVRATEEKYLEYVKTVDYVNAKDDGSRTTRRATRHHWIYQSGRQFVDDVYRDYLRSKRDAECEIRIVAAGAAAAIKGAWYTACAGANEIVLFSGPSDKPLYKLYSRAFRSKSIEDLVGKLTGPQGRDVPLGEITDVGSWRAGVMIWEDNGGEYEFHPMNVFVYRSNVAGEYVVSYDSIYEHRGWHFCLSHENLVELLESLFECIAAADNTTKKEGSSK